MIIWSRRGNHHDKNVGFVAFDTNCSKDVDDTRGVSRLLYFKRDETGAFFNNSWRISLGGQWRVAAATALMKSRILDHELCVCEYGLRIIDPGTLAKMTFSSGISAHKDEMI